MMNYVLCPYLELHIVIDDAYKSKKCTEFIEYMNKRTLGSYSAFEELDSNHKYSCKYV